MFDGKINIAIVDDHIAIREGYSLVISRFDFINNIYTYTSPAELYKDILSLQIQIILMDIEMKTEDGIASCGHIKALYPDVKILMVSAHHSESYILKAFKNKADGYFFKDQDAEELREALKHLMGNQKYYQHEVKKLLLENQLRKNDNELHNKYNLSAKEVAVLEMILKGYSVKQMSDALYRSENTIATHRKNIMHKIGAHREADIVQFAIKSGLMKSE